MLVVVMVARVAVDVIVTVVGGCTGGGWMVL